MDMPLLTKQYLLDFGCKRVTDAITPTVKYEYNNKIVVYNNKALDSQDINKFYIIINNYILNITYIEEFNAILDIMNIKRNYF